MEIEMKKKSEQDYIFLLPWLGPCQPADISLALMCKGVVSLYLTCLQLTS